MIEQAHSVEAVTGLLVSHPWAKERRLGVQHLVTGQHRAAPALVEDDETGDVKTVYLLAYAPADGHGINVIIFQRELGDWAPVPVLMRFDRRGERYLPLRDGFEPTESMRKVLDGASTVELGQFFLL